MQVATADEPQEASSPKVYAVVLQCCLLALEQIDPAALTKQELAKVHVGMSNRFIENLVLSMYLQLLASQQIASSPRGASGERGILG